MKDGQRLPERPFGAAWREREMPRYNKRMVVRDGHGGWKLRAWHRKRQGRRSPRCLIKCGCCDNKIEIFHDEYGLEIAGVNASKQQWRKLLLPILR